MQSQVIYPKSHVSRVELPVIFSAEQCCFKDSTFFGADSENMKDISAYQLCLRADQL